MALLDDLKKKFLGPKSKFKVGDSVQLHQGRHLMVVTQIFSDREMSQPLIDCKWFESDTKATRTNLFSEEDLEIFDWYKAQVTAHSPR